MPPHGIGFARASVVIGVRHPPTASWAGDPAGGYRGSASL